MKWSCKTQHLSVFSSLSENWSQNTNLFAKLCLYRTVTRLPPGSSSYSLIWTIYRSAKLWRAAADSYSQVRWCRWAKPKYWYRSNVAIWWNLLFKWFLKNAYWQLAVKSLALKKKSAKTLQLWDLSSRRRSTFTTFAFQTCRWSMLDLVIISNRCLNVIQVL